MLLTSLLSTTVCDIRGVIYDAIVSAPTVFKGDRPTVEERDRRKNALRAFRAYEKNQCVLNVNPLELLLLYCSVDKDIIFVLCFLFFSFSPFLVFSSSSLPCVRVGRHGRRATTTNLAAKVASIPRPSAAEAKVETASRAGAEAGAKAVAGDDQQGVGIENDGGDSSRQGLGKGVPSPAARPGMKGHGRAVSVPANIASSVGPQRSLSPGLVREETMSEPGGRSRTTTWDEEDDEDDYDSSEDEDDISEDNLSDEDDHRDYISSEDYSDDEGSLVSVIFCCFFRCLSGLCLCFFNVWLCVCVCVRVSAPHPVLHPSFRTCTNIRFRGYRLYLNVPLHRNVLRPPNVLRLPNVLRPPSVLRLPNVLRPPSVLRRGQLRLLPPPGEEL